MVASNYIGRLVFGTKGLCREFGPLVGGWDERNIELSMVSIFPDFRYTKYQERIFQL